MAEILKHPLFGDLNTLSQDGKALDTRFPSPDWNRFYKGVKADPDFQKAATNLDEQFPSQDWEELMKKIK